MAQALQQKTATPVVSPPVPTPSPVRASGGPARVQLQSALRSVAPSDPAETRSRVDCTEGDADGGARRQPARRSRPVRLAIFVAVCGCHRLVRSIV